MARKCQVVKKAEKISDEKESEKGEKKVQKTPTIPKKKSPPPKKEKKEKYYWIMRNPIKGH